MGEDLSKHVCQMNFSRTLLIGLVLRILLIAFGSFVDHACTWCSFTFPLAISLNYTDIDYHVFSDAASLILQGQSPYFRETYRYTPLLYMIC